MVISGDFNAKVGNNRSYSPEVLSLYGLGDRNENGALLIDFASSNDLMIGEAQFSHKSIHKHTWTSPDGTTRNQIDEFLINRKWRSTLQDVRTLRGADAGSDHSLCIAKIVLKLKSPKKKTDPLMPLYD
jgi:endonuclease/exonuclease/phosphatase family metal-dependent hydrolase